MKFIEVRGCTMTDCIVTPNVSDDDAAFFGVYLGVPGDFAWQADFSYKSDALDWAWKLAALHNYKMQDKTFKEAA